MSEKKICEICDNEFTKSGTYQKYCTNCGNASGIYKILNKENGKVYIGQSVNIKKRFQYHKRNLKRNSHDNIHLQRAYNKYSINNFEFSIIEICNEELLTERELYWINFYQSHLRECGYNIDMPDEKIKNFKMSQETRDKLSDVRMIFDDDELISYLHEFYYHYGKVPVQRDLIGTNFPSYATYVIRFGTFKNALIEANLYDFIENKSLYDRHEYTKEEILHIFKIFIDSNGRYPSIKELKSANDSGLPTHNMILKYFGSTENLKNELGYDDNEILEKERIRALQSLNKLYMQDGTLTSITIDKSPITRSAKYYSENFGSLVNAYKLAGVPLEKSKNKTTYIVKKIG